LIQSYWRGFQSRRQYQHLKTKLKQNHPYFTTEEFMETIHKGRPLEKGLSKGNHQYSSGAYYTGQWLGGFRHGKGMMCWPDGSEFIGDWNFGFPTGKGKFLHFDGDSFEGQWRNPFVIINGSICLTKRSSTSTDFADGFGNI
jgi:hypothetical protein